MNCSRRGRCGGASAWRAEPVAGWRQPPPCGGGPRSARGAAIAVASSSTRHSPRVSGAGAAEQATHHTTPPPSATTGLVLPQGPLPHTKLLASWGFSVTAPLSARTPTIAPWWHIFTVATTWALDPGRDLQIAHRVLAGAGLARGRCGAARLAPAPSSRARARACVRGGGGAASVTFVPMDTV
eukprot:COSAG02_NODE_215_length_28614_cov_43.077047_24_plen_183_part_00